MIVHFFRQLFFSFLLLSFNSIKAQNFTAIEADSVHFKIYDYWQNYSSFNDTSGSEFFFIVLQTGIDSRIISVHILADANNQGVAVSQMRKFSIADFKGWKPKYFPNSSIFIPVYCNGVNGKKNYADQIHCDMTFAGLNAGILSKCKNSVTTSGIHMFIKHWIKD